MDYPKRPSHFAHRVVRQLFKTCAAMEIGETATLLVVFVAHTEDAKRYSAPPTFFNSQLLPILGLRKWEALDRARRVAVKAGWLHYEEPPSGTRKPGIYWANIPDQFANIDDAPIGDDRIREAYPLNGYGYQEAYPPNGYGEGDGEGDGRGYGRGDGEGEHPTLCPNPNPNPSKSVTSKKQKPKFQPPTLEEVAAYCRERRNHVDPEAFWAYYDTRDWKLKGNVQMKSWKSAIVTWEKNDFQRQQPASGGPVESDWRETP